MCNYKIRINIVRRLRNSTVKREIGQFSTRPNLGERLGYGRPQKFFVGGWGKHKQGLHKDEKSPPPPPQKRKVAKKPPHGEKVAERPPYGEIVKRPPKRGARRL